MKLTTTGIKCNLIISAITVIFLIKMKKKSCVFRKVVFGNIFFINVPNGIHYTMHLGGINEENLLLEEIYAVENLTEGWHQKGTLPSVSLEHPFCPIVRYQ